MKTILAMLLLAGAVQAAEVYTEPFAGGGAQGTIGIGSVSFTGGVAVVKFAATAPYVIPDLATLTLGSAFTGNFREAGLGTIGFSFHMGPEKPSWLYLELKGNGSIYQKILTPTVTTGWETFLVSVDSLEAGGWVVKEGTAEGFEAALEDVESVEVKVRRSGVTAREHAVDDFFVDALPGASGEAELKNETVELGWGSLRAGVKYTVQGSPTLAGPWSDTATVTATGSLQRFSIPKDPGQPHVFYRLRGP